MGGFTWVVGILPVLLLLVGLRLIDSYKLVSRARSRSRSEWESWPRASRS